MKIERDYLVELQNGFDRNDDKQLEETLNAFYNDYNEAIDNDEESKFEEFEYLIMKYFYDKIIAENALNLKIKISYALINSDLFDYVITPYWMDLVWSLNENLLSKKISENDLNETVGENLFTEMKNIAEAYAMSEWGLELNNRLLNKELIKFIEEKMKDLSNIIMIGTDYKITKKRKIEKNLEYDKEKYKKFRGNSLQKRKTENVLKYPRVAKIIKIIEDQYPKLHGAQTAACNIAGCNSFSFARWKNYSNNFNMFLKWQSEIKNEEIAELKIDIENYYKLHTDM